MQAGFLFLVLAYGLSQFYRAFLAVLAPALEADLGATAEDLARASGLWFLAFAAMQIPVGAALDRIGPRRTAGTLLIVCAGGGAALFAAAGSPGAIVAAMTLIGAGCAPILVSAFYILARTRPPGEFATLAGLIIGVSSLGNIGAAAPTALAVEAFGWRTATAGMAAATALVGLGLLMSLRDPAPAAPAPAGSGGIGAILRQPGFWALVPLLLVNYAPAAGVRGLWIGPYLRDVHGLDLEGIGRITLIMAAAMILGNFAYGPADRLFRTRKWVLVAGNGLAAAALIALGLAPDAALLPAAAALAALGFFGASYPLVMAHARSWYPPHLVGRGVTFANLLAIGGVGVLQLASGRLFEARIAAGAAPEAAYGAIFLFFGALLAAGVAVYLLARDRLD